MSITEQYALICTRSAAARVVNATTGNTRCKTFPCRTQVRTQLAANGRAVERRNALTMAHQSVQQMRSHPAELATRVPRDQREFRRRITNFQPFPLVFDFIPQIDYADSWAGPTPT